MDNSTNQTTQSGHVQKQKTDETWELSTVRTTESPTASVSIVDLEPQVTTTTQLNPSHTEELLTPVHIEQQDTLRLQNKTQLMYEKHDARCVELVFENASPYY